MANYSWPSTFVPLQMSVQRSSQFASRGSMFGFKEQTVSLLNDRWVLALTFGLMDSAKGAQLEAMLHRLRAGVHTTELPVFTQRTPRGTCQASGGLAENFVQGSNRAVLLATTGETLLTGDYVGINGKLFRVREDAVAVSGEMEVRFVNRASKLHAAGAAVVLDSPTCRVHLPRNDTASVNYDVNSLVSGVTVDFLEDVLA